MATLQGDDSRTSVDSHGGDESHGEFNRIRLDSSFRDKILSEFNDDSSESLALPGVTISEPSESSSSPQKATPATLPPLSTSPPRGKPVAPSRLSQVVQSSDIPTPKTNQLNDPFTSKTPTGSNSNMELTPTPSGATSTSANALSKISTAEDSEGKPPKQGRPGTMRRLTSRIKKTISSKG